MCRLQCAHIGVWVLEWPIFTHLDNALITVSYGTLYSVMPRNSFLDTPSLQTWACIPQHIGMGCYKYYYSHNSYVYQMLASWFTNPSSGWTADTNACFQFKNISLHDHEIKEAHQHLIISYLVQEKCHWFTRSRTIYYTLQFALAT